MIPKLNLMSIPEMKFEIYFSLEKKTLFYKNSLIFIVQYEDWLKKLYQKHLLNAILLNVMILALMILESRLRDKY